MQAPRVFSYVEIPSIARCDDELMTKIVLEISRTIAIGCRSSHGIKSASK